MDLYQNFCTKAEDLSDSISLLERASQSIPSELVMLQEDLKFVIEGVQNELDVVKETLFRLENEDESAYENEHMKYSLYI